MTPAFDARDAEILAECVRNRDAIEGPRVGDFVYMLDGSLRRFTCDWDDGLQTTCGPGSAVSVQRGDVWTSGSFYLSKCGGVSFSGSLDRTVAREKLVATGETRDGAFWFFHHGFAGADLGVGFETPCRVYRVPS